MSQRCECTLPGGHKCAAHPTASASIRESVSSGPEALLRVLAQSKLHIDWDRNSKERKGPSERAQHCCAPKPPTFGRDGTAEVVGEGTLCCFIKVSNLPPQMWFSRF